MSVCQWNGNRLDCYWLETSENSNQMWQIDANVIVYWSIQENGEISWWQIKCHQITITWLALKANSQFGMDFRPKWNEQIKQKKENKSNFGIHLTVIKVEVNSLWNILVYFIRVACSAEISFHFLHLAHISLQMAGRFFQSHVQNEFFYLQLDYCQYGCKVTQAMRRYDM